MTATSLDDLWPALTDCPPDALHYAAIAYRIGLLEGFAQGHHAAQQAMAISWHDVWLQTRAVLEQPTHDQLRARRGETRRTA